MLSFFWRDMDFSFRNMPIWCRLDYTERRTAHSSLQTCLPFFLLRPLFLVFRDFLFFVNLFPPFFFLFDSSFWLQERIFKDFFCFFARVLFSPSFFFFFSTILVSKPCFWAIFPVFLFAPSFALFFFSFESALFFLFSYGGLFFLRPLFALFFFFCPPFYLT